MKWERIILLVFFGNYIINEVASGLSALAPVGTDGSGWGPYVVFVILAVGTIKLLSWWFFKTARPSLRAGLIFGVVGAVVSILTTFVSGIFGTLFDTGSLGAVWGVIPGFFLYIWDVSTLVLIGYWVIPAALVGWYLERRAPRTTPVV